MIYCIKVFRQIFSFVNPLLIISLLVLMLTLTFYTCGSNSGGQTFFKDIKGISAGGYHTVSIRKDGSLWSWGRNSEGQLGDGTIIDRSVPIQVGTTTQQDWRWEAISAGDSHTVAIKSDGTLWSWGLNGSGQLGDNSITDRPIPVQVGDATQQGWQWEAVSAGGEHTVAIKSNGTLWAWGDNYYGQLGDNSITDSPIPVQVGDATQQGWQWEAVSAGGEHTVVIKSDGTLWAGGYNTYGQLGDGTNTDSSSLLPVMADAATPFTDVKEVSAGRYHTVAIKENGSLWAWGRNAGGQLGTGDTIDSLYPVRIGTANDWETVSAGRFHTAAIKKDGSLWAWGRNSEGQLGDGTIIDRSVPVKIEGKWIGVSAGDSHTLAIRDDGTLYAWGQNTFGQLGDTTKIGKITPVKVIHTLGD